MTVNLLLVIVVGVLFAAGISLLLERTLTRVVLGVTLLGNGANLLILLGGAPGGPPIVGTTPEEEMSDPLPQAMILTAIVITFGMTAFLLAMAYRSWVLVGHDEVQDDIEDRRIMRLAELDEGPDTEDEGPEDENTEDESPDDGSSDDGSSGPERSDTGDERPGEQGGPVDGGRARSGRSGPERGTGDADGVPR